MIETWYNYYLCMCLALYTHITNTYIHKYILLVCLFYVTFRVCVSLTHTYIHNSHLKPKFTCLHHLSHVSSAFSHLFWEKEPFVSSFYVLMLVLVVVVVVRVVFSSFLFFSLALYYWIQVQKVTLWSLQHVTMIHL